MRSYVDALCRLLLACGVLALCLTGQAGAVTVTLEASQGNTLYENAEGNLSNGAGQHFFVGRVGPRAGSTLRRGLIMFDVASLIPPGSVINSVELNLNASSQRGSSSGLVLLHPVLVPWGEGDSVAPGAEGGGGPAQPGDATWLHTFFDTVLWTNPGGDFDPQSSGSMDVTSNGPQVAPSTAEMVADVQAWLDDPASNNGWLLILDNEAESEAMRFDSRHNTNPDVRPQLVVDVSLPPLLISPPSGTYAQTQVLDVVVFFSLPEGTTPTGITVLLDGEDASSIFASCVPGVLGTVVGGGQTLRCPAQNASDIGPGSHLVEVILSLSDGTSLQQSVNWLILENIEP
ncbi:MAG: hypothetical protein ETSY1_42090 [Candidatus Entotheonella factor]|uniref:DNRLRE domain-containing protein n=1 Tax=Entotheonella factor TaxID=1429438 RepID=W4L3Z4_ENTF1|nr:MAG: hypothetical protein ETSY1_42090 [Candidatus Entotheonella factor]